MTIETSPIAVAGSVTDALTKQMVAASVCRWINRQDPLPHGAEIFPLMDATASVACFSNPKTKKDVQEEWLFCHFNAGLRLGNFTDTINPVAVHAINGFGGVSARWDKTTFIKRLALLDDNQNSNAPNPQQNYQETLTDAAKIIGLTILIVTIATLLGI